MLVLRNIFTYNYYKSWIIYIEQLSIRKLKSSISHSNIPTSEIIFEIKTNESFQV